jgi:diguanylate cyclase (GGDEF)-like protein
MATEPNNYPDFYTDELTSSGNLLAFIHLLQQGFRLQPGVPFSLICLDINHLSKLDHIKGDTVLRWAALVLTEETGGTLFRIGGDEFVLVISEGLHAEHQSMAQQIYHRLNSEAARFGMKIPAASIALLHYSSPDEFTAGQIISQIETAIVKAKAQESRTFKAYQALSLRIPRVELFEALIGRVEQLSTMLAESNQLAYTDPVTGLPNLRAARRQLDANIARPELDQIPFAILLIDGDDLRVYNQVSYAAGDEMILNLANLIKEQLRPGDFLARWRVGDEFLVLLPNTDLPGALAVGRRLCHLVASVSRSWLRSVTISIGIAVFPEHGRTVAELVDQAESANYQAKMQGKNRVVVAG